MWRTNKDRVGSDVGDACKIGGSGFSFRALVLDILYSSDTKMNEKALMNVRVVWSLVTHFDKCFELSDLF